MLYLRTFTCLMGVAHAISSSAHAKIIIFSGQGKMVTKDKVKFSKNKEKIDTGDDDDSDDDSSMWKCKGTDVFDFVPGFCGDSRYINNCKFMVDGTEVSGDSKDIFVAMLDEASQAGGSMSHDEIQEYVDMIVDEQNTRDMDGMVQSGGREEQRIGETYGSRAAKDAGFLRFWYKTFLVTGKGDKQVNFYKGKLKKYVPDTDIDDVINAVQREFDSGDKSIPAKPSVK